MEKLEVYEVRVETTNGMADTFTDGKEYFDCESSVVYVATNCPAEMFNKFGEAIRAIKKLGICYVLREEK